MKASIEKSVMDLMCHQMSEIRVIILRHYLTQEQYLTIHALLSLL